MRTARTVAPRRVSPKVAVAAVGALACTAAVAIAATGIGLPTSLSAQSGPDPAGPGDPTLNGSSIGADGSVTLTATGTKYRFVTIASSSAWGGKCYGIRRVGADSPFATVVCPETSASASEFLNNMTTWHSFGTTTWADPIFGFVGAGVDHVLIKTTDQDYTLPVINGVYDYEGRLDGVQSISAIASDGTILQTVKAPVFPWSKTN